MSSATTRKPWSLAARLTAGFAAAAFVLIALATGMLDWAIRSQFDREQDDILLDKARVLAALIHEPTTDEATLRREVEWEWNVTKRARVAMRIGDTAGVLLLESPDMTRNLPGDIFPQVDSPSLPVVGRDGTHFRVISARATTARGDPRLLQLALDRSEDEEVLGEFRTVLWSILAVSPIVCAFVGYRVARRGLRPLADVSAAAARINASTLGERIEAARMPTELADLSFTFNAMLDRLEDAFARVTRFSADIAHELRTPLQVLRGEAEVALTKARSPEEYRHVLGSGLEEYGRLGKLIDTLLFLARADNPESQIVREPLNLAKKLSDTVAFYEPMAVEAGVSLTAEAEPGLVASLDRTLLQRLLGNLVVNALAHTPAGGRIVLRSAWSADGVQIEVEDTGRGIAPEHLPYIFDRFYRADDARSTSAGRVGLGLALVKSIATLHGGRIEVQSELGRGTRFRVTMPASA